MKNHISTPLSYIEGRKLLKTVTGKPTKKIKVCSSCTCEPLIPYIEGEIARYGFAPCVEILPFGTLQQYLLSEKSLKSKDDVLMLLPWDLVPSTEWRLNSNNKNSCIDYFKNCVDDSLQNINKNSFINMMYIDAPLFPIGIDENLTLTLSSYIKYKMTAHRIMVIENNVFNLDQFLISGFPFEGMHIAEIANQLVNHLTPRPPPKKVLITDLDNTFWGGVAAEDDYTQIMMGPDDFGYKHFIYQRYLNQLEKTGVVIAAVTRNSEEIVETVFSKIKPMFDKNQFVAIIASYSNKSAQIEELAKKMNLGLDSFVFVDDNEIEIHEVNSVLPDVTTLLFPKQLGQIQALIEDLSRLLHRTSVTNEDRDRTHKYKMMLKGVKPKYTNKSNLLDFLKSLEMKLTIRDRSYSQSERPLQLINKTNQFNSNGRRYSDVEYSELIRGGASVYTGSLTDVHGDHGEILVCIVNSNKEIISLVMSCRVFQREVEYVFLLWLFEKFGRNHIKLNIAKTIRNEPFFNFIGFLDASVDGDICSIFLDDIMEKIGAYVNLIEVMHSD